MKNIFIMDEHQSSQKNGLGVFVKELIKYLAEENLNIYHLDMNTDNEEFEIEEIDSIKRFCFPKLQGYASSDHAELLDVFFRLYIEDSEDNIFILNHSPCQKLILSIIIGKSNSVN